MYFEKLFQRFDEKVDIPRSRIQTITFPRFSVRDYLAISANEEHHARIQTAFQNMLNGPWANMVLGYAGKADFKVFHSDLKRSIGGIEKTQWQEIMRTILSAFDKNHK